MEFNGGKRKLEDNLFMTPIHSKKRVCLSKLHKQNTTADVLPVDVMEDQEAEGEVVKPGVKDEEIPEMSMEVVVTSGVLEGNHSSGEDLEEIEGSGDDDSLDDGEEEEEDSSEEEGSSEDEGWEGKMPWTVEQEQLLESALASYTFLPRTCVDKVLMELRRPGSSCGLTKARVRAWFTARKPGMARKGPDRWDVRTARLKELEQEERGQEPVTSIREGRVKFSPDISVKILPDAEDSE